MSHEEQYETLLQKLRRAGEHELATLIALPVFGAASPRIKLHITFGEVAKHFDDARCVKLFAWIGHAILDEECLPLWENGKNPDEKKIPRDKWKEKKDAVARADAQLVKDVYLLWLQLPEHGEQKCREHDSGREWTEPRPCLPKTRLLLLTTVVDHWAKTENKDEAARAQTFLLKVLQTRFGEEATAYANMLRTQMYECRDFSRLGVFYRALVAQPKYLDRYTLDEAVRMAWARKRVHERAGSFHQDWAFDYDFSVVEPMVDASPGAWEVLGKLAKKIGFLDENVRVLTDEIDKAEGGHSITHVFTYVIEDVHRVRFILNLSWCKDESNFHTRFEAVRDRIKAWCATRDLTIVLEAHASVSGRKVDREEWFGREA